VLAGCALSAWSLRYMMETGGTPTVIPACARQTVLRAPDDLGIESFTLWALRDRGLALWRPSVPFGQRVHGTSRWNRGLPSQLDLMRHLLATVRGYRALLDEGVPHAEAQPDGG